MKIGIEYCLSSIQLIQFLYVFLKEKKITTNYCLKIVVFLFIVLKTQYLNCAN